MVLALAGDGACAAAGDAGDWVLRLGFRRAQAKRPQDGSCAGNDAGLSDGLAGAIIAQRAETQIGRETCQHKRRSCRDRSGNGLFLDWHFEAR